MEKLNTKMDNTNAKTEKLLKDTTKLLK